MLQYLKYKNISSFCFSTLKSQKEKVVILGAGWGGFNVARSIDRKQYDVTLISPRNHFLFTPLLPSTSVGTLEFRCIQEPIRTIKNMHYIQAKANNIDFQQQIICCQDAFKKEVFDVKYDKLVIAVGSKTNTFGTPGVDKYLGESVFFLKQLYHARMIRNRIIECFERAAMPHIPLNEKKRLLSFVVVGGGPTSCEFTSELHDFLYYDMPRLYPDLQEYVQVHLIEAGPDLLGSFDQSLKNYVQKLFKKRYINVKTGVSVKGLSEEQIPGHHSKDTFAELSNGTKIQFGMLVWSAGLQSVKLVKALDGIKKGKTGRIEVNEQLKVQLIGESGHLQNVFALGDCAANSQQPLPQIAQAAQQQGKFVANYINKNLKSDEVKFELFNLGSMASIGQLKGVYDGTHVGNPYGKEYKIPKISGFLAFLVWRTGYWGKQVSLSNKILIPMHWFKSYIFGRDISRF